MAEFEIPYGRDALAFALPDLYSVHVLSPAPLPTASDPARAVCDALDHPVGPVRLEDFKSARSVAIAINDKTRPVPLALLLPPLLERLTALGIAAEAITCMIATGTHAPMPAEAFGEVLPLPILAQYRVVSHDCNDKANLVYRGETTRGTPVWLNRTLVEADLRIAVGNLEPHQFMGFSGGVKAPVIGLAGRETINRNHSMMMDPRSRIARYEDNPMRQDVEEMGDLAGIHFALNALLNENKQLVAALAGAPRAVMAQGVPRVLELYRVRVAEPFDLMITSPGGHPKDINLYQAQKALAHGSFVTRKGGTVILVAACPEGTGSRAYEEWIRDKTSHQEVLAQFKQEGFRIGPHKAFQLARDSVRERVLMVTDMPSDFVKSLLLTPCKSLDAALALGLADLKPGARIGILPYANATIPELIAG
ncbi:MAG: nickel-dependent lactate racemase [Anaerolineae bacterium]